MLRILLTCGLLHLALSLDESSPTFDHIFNDNIQSNKTIDALKCAGVIGSANQCLACYTCDHIKVRSRPNSYMYKLQLKDSSCRNTDVCCIAANQLVARNSDKCGVGNPEGLPRRRRPTLRSVLEREYPWRAWVYSSNNQTPLCAASYIYYGVKALLTTASCVSGRSPSSLGVRFTKTQIMPHPVKAVIVHERFDKTTRENDIAILTLSGFLGNDVQPICVPPILANYGTSCVSVSEKETYINSVIPQQKECGTESNLGNSTMCTSSPFGETPEGAGVYCLEEQAVPSCYGLYGISLNSRNSTTGMSLHTNVGHFEKWIQLKCSELQNAALKNN